jgi:gliding motility-associated-like protein
VLNNWFNYPISWIIGDNYYPDRDSIEFPLVDSGLLRINLIIDKPNCPDTIAKYVYVHIPPIIVDMPKDTAICRGQSIRVCSPNTENWHWSNGSQNPTITPQYAGIYTLTASNKCYSKDSSVWIEILDCDNELYVPNAFTPNGNGLNETFKPLFSRPEYIEEYKFFIYNRWGNLLYFTKDMYDGWTGYGSDEGVYVYVIEYKNQREKRKQIKGTVTLFR